MNTNDKQTAWEQKISFAIRKGYIEFCDKENRKNNIGTSIEFIIKEVLPHFNFGIKTREHWLDGENKINLVRLFNPITFLWQSPEYMFTLFLNSTIKVFQEGEKTKLANAVFEALRNTKFVNWVPRPYKGSRYHMYLNGIFDTKTKSIIKLEPEFIDFFSEKIEFAQYKTTLEIDGEKVPIPLVGFTTKHLHYLELEENPELPKFKAPDGALNDDWNPRDWLWRVANWDPDKLTYLLQILGVALTPNHSFDAFIQINGKSGNGKSTLVNIIANIYGIDKNGVLVGKTPDEMNDTFPFRGNINTETVLVNVTELNGTGIKNSTISLINSFANEEMMIKQMGATSLRLSPPPILILDGVNWALFDSTTSGIARRLLPLDITDSDVDGYLADMGKTVLTNERVIKWFAWQIEVAYSELVQGNDHFKFQIYNPETLPPFAAKWHTMAVNAGDDFMTHYIERITPYLSDGYIPSDLMYQLYVRSIKLEDEDAKYVRSRRSFRNALKVYLQENYIVEEQQSMQKHEASELGIDLIGIKKAISVPDDIINYEASKYATYVMPGWFKITGTTVKKEKEDNELLEWLS